MMPRQSGSTTLFRDGVVASRRLFRALRNEILGTIIGVKTDRRIVALTFDDGPHPENTPQILSILSRHSARATFFMIGECARRHPELLERVAAGGHAIGNHSWDHPSFPEICRTERFRQLRTCGAALAPYGSRLFRPPYGHQSVLTRMDAMLLGYRVVAWSGHVEDWRPWAVEELTARLLRKTVPGGIVLLHDALYDVHEGACADRTKLFEALDRVLHRLRGEYEFVTVPELLQAGWPRRKIWRKEGAPEWLTASTTRWKGKCAPN